MVIHITLYYFGGFLLETPDWGFSIFSCDLGALQTRLPVHPLACLTYHISPFPQCSCHIIMTFSVITIDISDAGAISQGQRSSHRLKSCPNLGVLRFYVLHDKRISCVITNCGQHQWLIPSPPPSSSSWGLTGKTHNKMIASPIYTKLLLPLSIQVVFLMVFYR